MSPSDGYREEMKGEPMKVYLVWLTDWEDQDVLSVWLTREEAEAEMERVRQLEKYRHVSVMEMTVGERGDPA